MTLSRFSGWNCRMWVLLALAAVADAMKYIPAVMDLMVSGNRKHLISFTAWAREMASIKKWDSGSYRSRTNWRPVCGHTIEIGEVGLAETTSVTSFTKRTYAKITSLSRTNCSLTVPLPPASAGGRTVKDASDLFHCWCGMLEVGRRWAMEEGGVHRRGWSSTTQRPRRGRGHDATVLKERQISAADQLETCRWSYEQDGWARVSQRPQLCPFANHDMCTKH